MIDLSTTYLGLKLKNPLVVSDSPLTEDIENVKKMESAGAGAIVMHSLFEEQITMESHELDRHLSQGEDSYAESLSYFPDMAKYNLGPEGYLDHIRQIKKTIKIPVIGSLNGVSTGTWKNWADYAQKIEAAGADAIELNIYFIPTDPQLSGEQIERLYLDLVRAVKQRLHIPLSVKIGPYFSSTLHMARRLEQAGADGLVLFNRFYQPDFDLEGLMVVPTLALSTPYELRLRLHWVAIMFPHLKADLAVTGGVHTAEDALKALMAGARVTMMTSALLRNGIGYLGKVLSDLSAWMEQHEYQSVRQMQGSMSYSSVAEPAAFERANYLRVLSSYTGKA